MLTSENYNSLFDDYTQFVNTTLYREESGFLGLNNRIFELSYNENPLGCSKKAIDIIKKISVNANRYPPIAYKFLREKIASLNKINKDEIIIGSGSLDIINSAMRLNANKDDEIIYSKSSIPMYNWGVRTINCIPRTIPLDKELQHDLDRILNSINNKTRAIILDNPHNPTGLYLRCKRLLEFIKKVPKNILIIIDQAYIEYIDKEEDTLIRYINRFNNLLLTRTFSKIYGLAGLRIGYGISSKENIRRLISIRLGNVGITNILGCYAAYYSLDDSDFVSRSKRFNSSTKENLYQVLSTNSIEFKNSEANFILIKVGDSKSIEKRLSKLKVRITPGYTFGYRKWIRMSFDKKLISNLSIILREIKKG